MTEELLSRSFTLHGRDFDKAGETSTEIKAMLKELGIDPQIIRRVVVVCFEAEMNVVMYADEGTLTFVLTDDDIGIEIADRGPGIPDLERRPAGGLVDGHRRDARDGVRLRHGAAEHQEELRRLRHRAPRSASGPRSRSTDQPRR